MSILSWLSQKFNFNRVTLQPPKPVDGYECITRIIIDDLINKPELWVERTNYIHHKTRNIDLIESRLCKSAWPSDGGLTFFNNNQQHRIYNALQIYYNNNKELSLKKKFPECFNK